MPRPLNSNDLYFLTVTVVDWIDIFTRHCYKQFIIKNLSFCRENKGLRIYEYVLMSNHLHLIAQAEEKPMNEVIRDFKTFTSKELYKSIYENPQESRKSWMLPLFQTAGESNPSNKHFQVWQNGNYPVVLYSQEMIQQKINYIHQNPVRAGIVAEPHLYLHSSACPDSPLKCDEW